MEGDDRRQIYDEAEGRERESALMGIFRKPRQTDGCLNCQRREETRGAARSVTQSLISARLKF